MSAEVAQDFPPSLRPPAWVMAFALAVSVLLAFMSRADLAYWLRSPEPLELGQLGSYRLDGLEDGAFARISGALGPPASRTILMGAPTEIRIIISTNVFVERRARKENSPMLAYKGEGRVVRASTSRDYAPVAEFFRSRGYLSEGKDAWILQDGERPREGLVVPLGMLFLLAFAGLNVAGLLRAWRERRRPVEG